jgi:hypothetical protein
MEHLLHSSTAKARLNKARKLVLDWIRVPHRDPLFLEGEMPAEARKLNEAIARRFLRWVADAGFACEVADLSSERKPGYEARWTLHGSSFVGFKQPPPEDTPDDALLAGCAALLENQWCRSRLPA